MWWHMPRPFFTAFFTSEILKFDFLRMKESLFMPRSVLLDLECSKGSRMLGNTRLETSGRG